MFCFHWTFELRSFCYNWDSLVTKLLLSACSRQLCISTQTSYFFSMSAPKFLNYLLLTINFILTYFFPNLQSQHSVSSHWLLLDRKGTEPVHHNGFLTGLWERMFRKYCWANKSLYYWNWTFWQCIEQSKIFSDSKKEKPLPTPFWGL